MSAITSKTYTLPDQILTINEISIKITHLKRSINPEYFYEINKKFYLLDETATRSIHHNILITSLKEFKIRNKYKILAIIRILTCVIFCFLAFYTHNYAWLIGILNNFITKYDFFKKILRLLKQQSYKTQIIKNLSRQKDNPIKLNALILKAMDFPLCSNFNPYIPLSALTKKYNLDVYYPLSINHINSLLNEKKYDHLIIFAHGLPNQITLNNFFLTKDNLSELNFTNLNEKAVIALYSCSTGALGGIAEKIANLAQRKVFAPTKICWDTYDVKFLSNNSLSYKFYGYRFDFLINLQLSIPFRFKNITRIIYPQK